MTYNFDTLIQDLSVNVESHQCGTLAYSELVDLARNDAVKRFGESATMPQSFKPFGEIDFPYHSMGAINSVHLFGLDELIIFSFYWANRNRYKRVADLGANIGLHSFVLGRCGFDVHSYEPDPETFKMLERTKNKNALDSVTLFNAAVSTRDGEDEFTRVIGNWTSSHLSGAKSDAYGELETFPVTLKNFGPIVKWADFMKIDVEGHEKELILSTDKDMWSDTDVMMEVGTAENAAAVYAHLKGLGVNMFSQKCAWGPVTSLDDVPTSYHQGSLFVTVKDAMPWG